MPFFGQGGLTRSGPSWQTHLRPPRPAGDAFLNLVTRRARSSPRRFQNGRDHFGNRHSEWAENP